MMYSFLKHVVIISTFQDAIMLESTTTTKVQKKPPQKAWELHRIFTSTMEVPYTRPLSLRVQGYTKLQFGDIVAIVLVV